MGSDCKRAGRLRENGDTEKSATETMITTSEVRSQNSRSYALPPSTSYFELRTFAFSPCLGGCLYICDPVPSVSLYAKRGSRYAVSFDATTTEPPASNATPTRPGPASTISGLPVGGTGHKLLDPASASTANNAPLESNARHGDRPEAAYRVVMRASGSLRYSES